MKASLIKRKARNGKYEHAVNAWKKHSEELEAKVREQNEQIKKLLPNKKKMERFERLCKEYHATKMAVMKKAMICRETQTKEVRIAEDEGGQGKENMMQMGNMKMKMKMKMRQ